MNSSRARSARLTIISMTTVGAIALAAPLALADTVKNNIAVNGPGQKGYVAPGEVFTASYTVQATGGTCDAADGSPLTLNVHAPAGATASPSALEFTSCDTWQSVSITIDGPTGRYDFPTASAIDKNGDYSVGSTAFFIEVVAPATDPENPVEPIVNRAPAVSVAAADASVNEGQEITAVGAFTDADGDTLTLSADSTAGTFSGNSDGTWTYKFATTDDVPATDITVTATDGTDTATDTFKISAANVAPVLSVTSTRGAYGCTVDVSGSWTDAGLADTHTGTSNLAGTIADLVSNPFSASRSFTSAGNYNLSATVADDDGGSATWTQAGGHTVNNIPSGILQPVNGTGPRSAFKLGSTVPVKITIADCGGSTVGTLAPQVQVIKIDSTPEGTYVETVSTATPTTGTAMRYSASDAQYIYNLSTKNLSVGDWKVKIIDPSFETAVIAEFSIRK